MLWSERAGLGPTWTAGIVSAVNTCRRAAAFLQTEPTRVPLRCASRLSDVCVQIRSSAICEAGGEERTDRESAG